MSNPHCILCNIITHGYNIITDDWLQECIRLLGQAEHQLTAALSLRAKLTHGLEMINKPITAAAENEIR